VSQPQSVTLTGREVIIDHGRRGGLAGLYSATGIKFTTARKVAEKTLAIMRDAGLVASGSARNSANGAAAQACPVSSATAQLTDATLFERLDESSAIAMVRAVAAEEAAVSADDFCLRRTNWMLTARDFGKLRRLVSTALEPGVARSAPAMQAGA